MYILWSDKRHSSYTGTTSDLNKRVLEHNNGGSRSTKAWRPWELIYFEKHETLKETRKREWCLKCTPVGGKLKQGIINEFLNDRDGGRKAAYPFESKPRST